MVKSNMQLTTHSHAAGAFVVFHVMAVSLEDVSLLRVNIIRQLNSQPH
jgi:hypothetical protein